jgi:hypothetical protein
MNWYLLEERIELSKPKFHFSSLPFIVKIDHRLEVKWFYYSAKDLNDNIEIDVINIYTEQEKEKVSIRLNPKVKVITLATQWDTPTLTIAEYLSKLPQLHKRYDEDAMIKLISKAEPAPMVEVYRKVLEYIKKVGVK